VLSAAGIEESAMDDMDRAQRKAAGATAHTVRSLMSQAAQMLRQYHRVGKVRTAGCRKALERLLDDSLGELRHRLATVYASVPPTAFHFERAATLVTRDLETVAYQFRDQYGDVMGAMDGFKDTAVEETLGSHTADVRAGLEQAVDEVGRAGRAADTSFVGNAELRRVAAAAAAEAARCHAAAAHAAAVVFAATALTAVLRDALEVREGDADELLEHAAARGLVPSELVHDGGWNAAQRELLRTQKVLFGGTPVDRDQASKVLELLHDVCRWLPSNKGTGIRD